MSGKVKVAVLGATGMIGQRFVQMLEGHPYFEIEGLYASERSEGKRFGDTLKVRDHEYSQETLDMKISKMDIRHIADSCRIAFSGIPSELAGETETQLAQNGVAVYTNAGAHRMDEHVPIIVPEVNTDQFAAVRVAVDDGHVGFGGFVVDRAVGRGEVGDQCPAQAEHHQAQPHHIDEDYEFLGQQDLQCGLKGVHSVAS